MIDFVGKAGPEIAERIVGERGKMDDRVDSFEIGELDVARIFPDGRHIGDDAALRKGAALIEIAVEASHLVPGLEQHGGHDGADVAAMSGQQNAHCSNTLLVLASILDGILQDVPRAIHALNETVVNWTSRPAGRNAGY